MATKGEATDPTIPGRTEDVPSLPSCGLHRQHPKDGNSLCTEALRNAMIEQLACEPQKTKECVA